MRQFLIVLITLVALPVLAAVPKTVTLDVQNMTCPVCPITVKKALEKVPGVSGVNIDFEKKTARVSFDADKTQPSALTTATTNAGYPSTVQK
jgi:mercuric ion binding protein